MIKIYFFSKNRLPVSTRRVMYFGPVGTACSALRMSSQLLRNKIDLHFNGFSFIIHILLKHYPPHPFFSSLCPLSCPSLLFSRAINQVTEYVSTNDATKRIP